LIGAVDMEHVKTIVLLSTCRPAAALDRALQLATAHAARLVLLHVIEDEPLTQAASVSRRSESDLRDQLRRQAVATIAPLMIERGRTRRTEVLPDRHFREQHTLSRLGIEHPNAMSAIVPALLASAGSSTIPSPTSPSSTPTFTAEARKLSC
jgi:hypothetical protein